MNSGFRPLPATMPFARRCWAMVERGEVKSFDEAVRKLRPKRERKPQRGSPANYRPPYADN